MSTDPMTPERLAQIRDWVRGVPLPGAWRLIRELLAEVDYQRAENARLRAAPCPHVVTSDEGTSWCDLAAQAQATYAAATADAKQTIAQADWLFNEVRRIARQLHRTGQHPAAIELTTAIEQAAAVDPSQTEENGRG